jgi:FMN phosphatase YigB (HAD superfamily)
MKIVFDLDYTLLDTVAFKKALVEATGVDEKEWKKAYDAAVEGNRGLFEPSAFFAELTGRELLTSDAATAARKRFDDVLATTEEYLYDEAKELVMALGKHDADIDLMTFGDASWQRAKVEHSGLARMFDDVLYAEKDKKEFIRALGEGQDKVIVVNDNGKEMEEMAAAAPEHTYILKSGGPKAPPKNLRLPAAETIGELVGILERETGWELRREMDEARREKKEGDRRVVEPGKEVRGEVEMGGDEPEDVKEPPSELRGSSRR